MTFIKGQVSAFKGRHHTQDEKRRIGLASRGNKYALGNKLVFTEEHKRKMALSKMGNKNPMKRPEVINKMIASRIGKGCGERNYNWKGGLTLEEYGKNFTEKLREEVRKRDNYRCQQCFRHQDELYYPNGKKYSLYIHHIDYDKKNNNMNNLISLCVGCHSQTNFTRENWINYFKNKVIER